VIAYKTNPPEEVLELLAFVPSLINAALPHVQYVATYLSTGLGDMVGIGSLNAQMGAI